MDSVWRLRSWARSAAGIQVMTTEQADAFELDQAVTRTPIRLTVTFFITAGTANE
jgi:hypothetical protein